MKLCGRLMKALSVNLGLEEEFLQKAFGGEDVGACLRVNFYPKCPKPELTLGLSSHSDPGGLTMLLPDPMVSGLQVRKSDAWITVKPHPHAFIVNIGDQIQVRFISSYDLSYSSVFAIQCLATIRGSGPSVSHMEGTHSIEVSSYQVSTSSKPGLHTPFVITLFD